MATFEQKYKEHLRSELTALVGSEIKVIATNDISLYAGPRTALAGDELFVITMNGQGAQLINTTSAYTYQKSIFNIIYVPLNYATEFMGLVTSWANDQSVDGVVHPLTHMEDEIEVLDYTFSVKYSTPNTDGIITRIGSVDYMMMTLTGDVIYSNIQLTFANEFKLKLSMSGTYTEVGNVLSWKWAPQPMGESVLPGTSYVTSRQRNGANLNLSVSVLFDGTNAVHKYLKQLAYKPTLANGVQAWKVLDDTVSTGYTVTFNGQGVVTIDGSSKSMTVLTLSISVEGDPS